MIISKTPMRMSFVGGGSDLEAYYRYGRGAVVSAAIDKFIYITVNQRFTDHIRVGYSITEYVERVEHIKHNLVRESLRLTDVTKGVDVAYMSDMLPDHEGSGLGASSSIVVGTLHALHAHKGEHVSAERLAQEACRIEIDTLGHPIGKQDQYAAAYGGFNYIQFNPDGTVFVEPIICQPQTREKLNRNLLAFHTGLRGQSATVLTEQRSKTAGNRRQLDQMVAYAQEMRTALQQNNLEQFGRILHENWVLKQTLASNITNPMLNAYYEKARQAGAVGGKVLGAGGGGFLLFYCEPQHQDRVRAALGSLREAQLTIEPQGSRIIYVG